MSVEGCNAVYALKYLLTTIRVRGNSDIIIDSDSITDSDSTIVVLLAPNHSKL
jgi:anti-anti-sigma regulatory factor